MSHWHRRTKEPVETFYAGRVKRYGCTHEGCDWWVIDTPGKPETYGDGRRTTEPAEPKTLPHVDERL